MMAMTESEKISGAKSCEASGTSVARNAGSRSRPSQEDCARITEPAVGASTCASGNQVCTGHIGIFTANEAKNASHARSATSAYGGMHQGRNVRCAAFQYSAMIASSISTEPSSV